MKKKKNDSSSEASSPDGEAFNSDDDILVKKEKIQESSDSDAEGDDKIIQPKKSKLGKGITLQSDKDVLNQLYGDTGDLDKTDRFLRDFILKEGWKANTMEEDDDHYEKYQKKKEKIY